MNLKKPVGRITCGIYISELSTRSTKIFKIYKFIKLKMYLQFSQRIIELLLKSKDNEGKNKNSYYNFYCILTIILKIICHY